MKLTEIKGLLPDYKQINMKDEYGDRCLNPEAEAFNDAIDEISTREITVDAEKMIEIINIALSDREVLKDKYMNMKIRPAIPKMADFISKAIINNLPSILKVEEK